MHHGETEAHVEAQALTEPIANANNRCACNLCCGEDDSCVSKIAKGHIHEAKVTHGYVTDDSVVIARTGISSWGSCDGGSCDGRRRFGGGGWGGFCWWGGFCGRSSRSGGSRSGSSSRGLSPPLNPIKPRRNDA